MADRSITLPLGRGTLAVPWNTFDRLVQAVAPVWAARRFQARVGHELVAQMGGFNGASTTRRSLAGWNPGSADADSDTLPDLPGLRGRTRDLERNSPVAGGAINTTVEHEIGTGLALMSAIDSEYLGLSEEQAEAWQLDTERKFNAWFETADCDLRRHCNGYALTSLVRRMEAQSGDVFAVLTTAPWARGPVNLAIQLIEADRCCNPDKRPDRPGLVAGVEMDAGGAPLRYHFASSNPYGRRAGGAQPGITWRSVEAFGTRTGARQVLHVFERMRDGQTRGVPLLAPVIEPLKQLERYTEAELMAAVVSGLFTVFIHSEGGGTSIAPSALANPGGAGAPAPAAGSSWNGQLGNGLVVDLGLNEKIETANPGRPNAQFEPFFLAVVSQIGMRLGIPREVLLKHYASSYSAARAAMLDAHRHFRLGRQRIADLFCQPVYEAFMDQAVAAGYVRAPGYFASPMVRRAWLGAMWVGDGPGSIDPEKEVNAAEKRIDLSLSTHEAESLLHDGGKHRLKVRKLLREQELMRGLVRAPKPGAPAPMPTPAPSPQTGAQQE